MWECYNDSVRRYTKNHSGFTLIELLLVIGILGILSVIGLGTFSSMIIKGKDSRRKNDLAQIARALELYKTDFGVYPDDDNSGGLVGCKALVSDPLTKCPYPRTTKFQTYKNSEKVVYLDKYPTEEDVDKIYYYQRTSEDGETGFALYASLENTQDKDVKRVGVDPDPEGWGIDCSATSSQVEKASSSTICNYKLTNSGVERE